jgi:anti-anti-sigma factor
MLRARNSCAQFAMDFDYDIGSTTLRLYGELDALSVPAFSGALVGIAERGTRAVTIDLSELRFCNVGGLRAMAELAARLHAREGRVRIVAPSILTRMLEIADLQSLFVIDDRPSAAAPADPIPEAKEINRAVRASRPRAGSLHRLPTGA